MHCRIRTNYSPFIFLFVLVPIVALTSAPGAFAQWDTPRSRMENEQALLDREKRALQETMGLLGLLERMRQSPAIKAQEQGLKQLESEQMQAIKQTQSQLN